MSLKTGANRSMSFDGLLVKRRRLFTALPEAVGTNWAEVPLRSDLTFRKPMQTFETNLAKIGQIRPAARHDQSLRKARIFVGHALLEPHPIGAGILPIERAQTMRQFCTNLVGSEITAQRAEVFVQTNDREGPCTRRRETLHGRQCLFKNFRRP